MQNKIKILAIGDFHGKLPKKLIKEAKKADFILSTGDFGGSDELLKIIFKYFYEDWWEKVGNKKAKKLILEDYNSGKKIINKLNNLKKQVYTVHGNWDFEKIKHKERTAGLKIKRYSELMKKMKNLHFFRKRVVDVEGLKVYFFGGMVTASVYLKEKIFDKKKINKFKKQHEKLRRQLFKKGRKGIDIFLSHYPPYGYFDVVKYKGENPMNGKHIGFKPYTEFIRKFQPRVFICGHMHEYQGMKKLGKTLIISTGSAKQGKAAWIEYPADGNGKVKVRFVK